MNDRICNIIAENCVWNKISLWFDSGHSLSQDSVNHSNPCVRCALISIMIFHISHICFHFHFLLNLTAPSLYQRHQYSVCKNLLANKKLKTSKEVFLATWYHVIYLFQMTKSWPILGILATDDIDSSKRKGVWDELRLAQEIPHFLCGAK